MIATEHITQGVFKLRFRALGSPCIVHFRAGDIETAKSFRRQALGWLRDFEQTWSRFRPDSLLSLINRSAGGAPVALSPGQERVVDVCERVFEASGGLSDPTILPLTRLWDAAAESDRLPAEGQLESTMNLVGWRKVERGPGFIRLPRGGMALDFGGFGKEFAVDEVRRIARDLGLVHVLVDLGRDIATSGNPPETPFWVVGIENPLTPDRAAFRLRLSGRAVASSGDSRRFRTIGGRRYSHHIDPRTGVPADSDVIAASCLADDCLTAGIFSRNACLLGLRDGLGQMQQAPGVEGLIQTSDSIKMTRSFYHHALPI